MINVELPFPTCERVVGVLGDYRYEVRSRGAWELRVRGRPAGEVLAGGTAESIAAGTAAAREKAKTLGRLGLKIGLAEE